MDEQSSSIYEKDTRYYTARNSTTVTSDDPANSDTYASHEAVSPQDYKTWWANHKKKKISEEEVFEAYKRYIEESSSKKNCVKLSSGQRLKRPQNILNIESKFALKYRLMSFYETREIIEDVLPYTGKNEDISQKTSTRKPAMKPSSTSTHHVTSGSSDISVWVEIHSCDLEGTQETRIENAEQITPTTSITTTATSGFGSGSGVVMPNQGQSSPPIKEEEDKNETSFLLQISPEHIWDYWLPPDQPFVDCTKSIGLTSNGRIVKCKWCQGAGVKSCKVCRLNDKKVKSCSNCSGNGSISVQQHYIGADYDNTWTDDILIKSGRINVNCEDCRGTGFAMEPFKCRACNGRGTVRCTSCMGGGKLVYERSLNVQYNTHSSWAILNDTSLPLRFLQQLRGVVIWEEESAEASNSSNLDKLLDGKSAVIRERHQEKLAQRGRILQQRQILSVIPIYEVRYRVSGFWTNTLYVCGMDRQVCVSEIVPGCCGIS